MFLFAGSLLACASIVDGGSTKPITITSEVLGQKFVVPIQTGMLFKQVSHLRKINLPRSGDQWAEKVYYKVSLEGSDNAQNVQSEITGWYLAGNFVFGGLIGYLVVDPLSGSMYTLAPKEVLLSE